MIKALTKGERQMMEAQIKEHELVCAHRPAIEEVRALTAELVPIIEAATAGDDPDSDGRVVLDWWRVTLINLEASLRMADVGGPIIERFRAKLAAEGNGGSWS